MTSMPSVPGADEGDHPAPTTASHQAQPTSVAPPWLVDLVRRLEEEERIDVAGRALRTLAGTVLRSPRAAAALRGTWLGHALHPLVTDFPLGAWMSASFLDLFGGPDSRRPARRLIGFGLLVSLPTAASGLAEWQVTTGRAARRVGVVHAAVNTTATVLYGSSWVVRRRGSHRIGVALGVGGGLVATLGGYLGGHLSLVRKVGTADTAFGSDTALTGP